MNVRKPKSPAGHAPWAAKTAAEFEARPPHQRQCWIFLLVDEDGAKLIAEGKMPEYVQEQAQRALEWTLEGDLAERA